MITALEAFSSLSSAPDLPLSVKPGAVNDLIHIREITGLGPVKADIATRSRGSIDGETITGRRTGKRNIVLTVGFAPDWFHETVASLRTKLYAYFMPGFDVRLRFYRDDGPTVDALGVVESCEPNIFSQDPEMQVSILCPDPDFIAVEESEVRGVAWNSSSWSSFSTVGTRFMPFELIVRDGGFSYDGAITVYRRTNSDADRTKFAVNGSITDGQYIRINSERGNKTAFSVVEATQEPINLIQTLTKDSTWLELKPGINQLLVRTSGTDKLPWVMRYFERFGGL